MPRTNRGDGPYPAAPRPPRRERYPDLSPARPQAVEADPDPWPAWCDIPVERLDPSFFEDAPRKGGC